MTRFLHTKRFTRGKLPHWEVEHGRYFVTVRCADSLPQLALERLREIHANVRAISSNSGAFTSLQRSYFRTLEKYLAEGGGKCVLRTPIAAESVIEELQALEEWHIEATHYSIMPNHWHAMLEPRTSCTQTLSEIIRRVKGRSARSINRALDRVGPLWQREWFDRWMRTDEEYDRCVRYIQDNPANAGVPQQNRWTQ